MPPSAPRPLPIQRLRELPIDQRPRPLRLLCIDGGAAAAVQTRILRRLCQDRPGLPAKVHLLAGASDGCLVSFFLAHGLWSPGLAHDGSDRSIQQDEAMVQAHNLSALDRLVAFVDAVAAGLHPRPRDWLAFLVGKRTLKDGKALRASLAEAFGRATLGSVEEKLLIGIAMNMADNRPRTYRNFGWEAIRADLRELVLGETLVDVARHSAGVPLLLPLAWSEGFPRETAPHLLADGSFTCNNPTMTAISNALSWLVGEGEPGGPPLEPPVPGKHEQLRHIEVLSLGADEPAAFQGRGEVQKGWPGWILGGAPNVGTIALNGWLLPGNTEVHNQARHLLGDRQIFRANPAIPLRRILRGLFLHGPEAVKQACDEASKRWLDSEEYPRMLAWLDERGWT